MKRLAAAVLALLIAACSKSTPTEPSNASSTFHFSAHCVDAGTGVLVQVPTYVYRDSAGQSDTLIGDNFVATLAAGTVVITVSHAGYVTQTVSLTVYVDTVTSPDTRNSTQVITLVRG
jgi:hypothetical protein